MVSNACIIYGFCRRSIDPILSKYSSGGQLFQRPVSSGKEDYQTDPSLFPLNEPVDKLEALIQSAGEATFANDIPPLPREVFGAFVLSTVHIGQVDTIDVEGILAVKGIVALFTANDIPGINSFGCSGIELQTEEEEIRAGDNIKFYLQPIAIVVAETQHLAEQAAKVVKVTYKNVSTATPVLTIDAAKKDSKRCVPGDPSIDPVSKGNKVTKVIKGILEMEAQYHYYIEPTTCVVIPVDKTLEVYDSTQWIDLTQIAIARSLGINESEVLVKVRRVGGGFGGKFSRNAQTSAACALVAKKLDRPCRFILPMQTNLTTAGKRLPCQCEYEVGVDDDGKIQYLNSTITEDSGCCNNEGILSFTAGGFPNCYNTETWTLKTATVTTDTPSNTFARAPACESILGRLEEVKKSLGEGATWLEIIKKAGDEQVELTALYMMQDTDDNLKGYNAYAVSITEVTLDVTTGRFQIDRVDILEDVGVSANPKLDIGQVQGAFMQGIGYFTCEKLIYDKKTGRLLTNRSLKYHVPLALDVPIVWNVKLRYNCKNPHGVLGSKTVPYDTETILKALDVKPEEFILTK